MTTDPAAPALKQRTVRAVRWSFAGQTGRQVLALAVALLLARWIAPELFGIAGMVLVVCEFTLLFCEGGFGAALVQRRSLEDRHLDTVFWTTLAAGAMLATALWLAAPALAAFYREPAVEPLARALAPTFVLASLTVVQQAVLTRELGFDRLARVEVTATLVSGAGALAAAAAGLGLGALVLQQLLWHGATAAGTWTVGSWRPGVRFSAAAARELLGFAAPLVGFQAINYWSRNADKLLIGRFVGATALGFYGHAYRIMVLPMNQVTRTLQRVMFPALATIQDEPERIGAIWLRANAVIALLTVPAICGTCVLADPLVVVALGDPWRPVVPLLQVLCIAAIKQPMGATTGWIYQSRGRTDLMLRWGLVSATVTIAGFVAGLPFGALGVATAYAVTGYVIWYPAITIPGRLVGIGFGAYVQNLAGVFGCALAMTLALIAMRALLPADLPPLLELAVCVPAGVLIYGALAWAFRLRALEDARATLRRRTALANGDERSAGPE